VAKRGLGKGMDALIPPEEAIDRSAAAGAVGAERRIALNLLKPNPDQPRKRFDEGELEELAASIREHGVIQPVIVKDAGDGTFTIVAGERRVRAARMAGLRDAPVVVRDYSAQAGAEVALIENVQRTDLNPVEEAAGYKRLMELTGLSQEEVAAKVGKSRSTVANALRLLKLPGPIRDALAAREIYEGHARAILAVEAPEDRQTLFQEIVKKGLDVREAERRAKALNARPGGDAARPVPRARDPHLDAMEENFIRRLGTRAVITGTLERGTVVIDYYSMEDLDRLYGLLGGGAEAGAP